MLVFELGDSLSPLAYEKVGEWMEKAEFGKYEIVKFKKTRTIQQNRYLRGGVYKTIADSIGEDSDYIHGVLSYKYLLDHSRKSPFVRSTTSLSTKEFGEYVDKITVLMSGLGIKIPTPEEFNLYMK